MISKIKENQFMTKLSVNINKVALIRNARGGNLPDLKQVAIDCESFGADGITVHPRPDERHIRYADIPILKEIVNTELNIEGYPNNKFIKLVMDNKPHQVTLVPDPPGVLTSSEGWNVESNRKFLTEIIQDFKSEGIRVSIFMDAKPDQMQSAKEVGTDRVELYTGDYADSYHNNPQKAVEQHILAAKAANMAGLALNAGHDLNLNNLRFYNEQVPHLQEVSIGHALISDALYYGLQNTIGMYKRLLTQVRT